MDLTNKLNSLAKPASVPRIDVKQLTREEGYQIISIRSINTKFGRAVVAEVETEEERKLTFLPKRFSSNLTEDDLKTMSEGGYILRCMGVIERSAHVMIYKK